MTDKLFGIPDVNHTDLYDKSTIWQIGDIYNRLNKKYFNRFTPFPVNSPVKKHDKQVIQVKKLIDICTEHDIQFEAYIRAQFETLGTFLKIKKAKFMIFSTMLGGNSLQRYYDWERKTGSRYDLRNEQLKAIHAPIESKKTRSNFNTALNKFIDRLMMYDEITEEVAIKELTMLLKMRAISPIYIYEHPLAEKTDFFKRLAWEQNKSLTKVEKQVIIKIRDEIRKENIEYI